MKKLRIYVDTSVFGGCFDDEFSKESNQLFEFIKRKNYILLISEIIEAEIFAAPPKVQDILNNYPKENLEILPYDKEVESLLNQYIKAGILSASSINDAAHVAVATIGDADLILSWNFRHIVNVMKIREFNAINLTEGYKVIDIRSPKELIYEEEV